MYKQRTECIQFWVFIQLDINGFIKSKKSEKRETSIEPPADLAAVLAVDLAADSAANLAADSAANLADLADWADLAYSSNRKSIEYQLQADLSSMAYVFYFTKLGSALCIMYTSWSSL